MKKLFRIAAAIAMVLSVGTTAVAQETEKESDKWYPHSFISLQDGAQVTFSGYDKIGDLVTPAFAVSAGRFFTPQLGARLHFQGYEFKGGYEQIEQTYKTKYITGDVDMLFNMLNIFNPNRASQRFNWNMILGFGVNYTWDYDDYYAKRAMMPYNDHGLHSERATTFNGRIGTQFEYNLSRRVAISIEIDGNYKNDRFNQRMTNKNDWQVAALAGLTFRFGMPKKKAKVVEEPVYVPAPQPEPEPEVAPEPTPQPEEKLIAKDSEKVENLKEVLYYSIRESETDASNAILDKVVSWAQKYPNKTISVRGYADKETGTPELNKDYAAQRAHKVAKILENKGISANRIEVESFGDTVQPFELNDMNRCVIIIGM